VPNFSAERLRRKCARPGDELHFNFSHPRFVGMTANDPQKMVATVATFIKVLIAAKV